MDPSLKEQGEGFGTWVFAGTSESFQTAPSPWMEALSFFIQHCSRSIQLGSRFSSPIGRLNVHLVEYLKKEPVEILGLYEFKASLLGDAKSLLFCTRSWYH